MLQPSASFLDVSRSFAGRIRDDRLDGVAIRDGLTFLEGVRSEKLDKNLVVLVLRLQMPGRRRERRARRPDRTMQRKPGCAVDVSIVSLCRAAGR